VWQVERSLGMIKTVSSQQGRAKGGDTLRTTAHHDGAVSLANDLVVLVHDADLLFGAQRHCRPIRSESNVQMPKCPNGSRVFIPSTENNALDLYFLRAQYDHMAAQAPRSTHHRKEQAVFSREYSH